MLQTHITHSPALVPHHRATVSSSPLRPSLAGVPLVPQTSLSLPAAYNGLFLLLAGL